MQRCEQCAQHVRAGPEWRALLVSRVVTVLSLALVVAGHGGWASAACLPNLQACHLVLGQNRQAHHLQAPVPAGCEATGGDGPPPHFSCEPDGEILRQVDCAFGAAAGMGPA